VLSTSPRQFVENAFQRILASEKSEKPGAAKKTISAEQEDQQPRPPERLVKPC
jgi:hypothetical protein